MASTMSASILIARRPTFWQRSVRSASRTTTPFQRRQYFNGQRGAFLFRKPSNSSILYTGTIFTGCFTAATLFTSTLYGTCMPGIYSTVREKNDNHDDVDEKVNESNILACSSSAVTLHGDDDKLRYVQRLVAWVQDWITRIWDIILVSSRSAEIAIRLSPLVILTPVAMLAEQFHTKKGINYMSDLSWSYAISAIQGLGPVAIKLCQWAATRRDIFPPHICDRLSQLHDGGYPHSWEHTKKILSECFGSSFVENGLHIEEHDVIGCGSAAQVYRGSLQSIDEDGKVIQRSVAIKVLHPNFQNLVDRDFGFIQSIADILHSFPIEHIRMLNLPRVVENFGTSLRLQADLTVEAKNLDQFRTNFYRTKSEEEGSSIVFPEPIAGWISPKAIVEEYIGDSTPIAEFLKDSTPAGLHIRKELAGPLLRAFLKMVFMDNFVHGDLHPGNVLVVTKSVPVGTSSFSKLWGNLTGTTNTQQSTQDTQLKRSIVFLDAGISNSLSLNDQQNLTDLFRAVIFNDGNRAGRLMVERAKYERCSQIEGGIDKFASGVEDIVSEFHDRRKEGLTLGAVRIGSLLTRVLDLCRVHGVEIDPAMANVVLSTLVLEGLGRSLEPNLNLIDFAKPFILGLGRV